MNEQSNTHLRRQTATALILWVMSLLLLWSAWLPASAHAAEGGQTVSDLDCQTNIAARKHLVNVAVATLWTEPGLARKLDAPSLTSPVDMDAWTKALNTADKRRWLTGKTETQALYGQELRLLQLKGDWAYVAVVGQATPKSSYGYPGWMPKSQLLTVTDAAAYRSCPVAIVSDQTTVLYGHDRSTSLLTLSFNTRLPIIERTAGWVGVHVPDGRTGWLKESAVEVIDPTKERSEPTAAQLIATGKRFLGLPYLWAGISAYGFDCSGFTSTIYSFHGIRLPRDASAQIKQGKAVSWNQLQPGDLMFFAHKQGKGSVHHVSMYIGDGNMIHSPKAGKTVEIISIHTPAYKTEFAGARRYIQ
ncbi:C40 family peptidase [Paenibacillus campi]|uniref:C40 family peptidase n=1 Tax=Paenibacillus campi TaxID=3106031 RepID=UPI002AFF6E68|nr:C40 family peptidase [Paenibacillus sp. SGZ-1009]